jgi:hypothetical protein
MRRYEFALVRYFHDLAGGEFANIGVVLFDVDQRRVSARLSDRYARLSGFFGEVNGSAHRSIVHNVERSIVATNQHLEQPDLIEGLPESLEQILNLVLPADESGIRASTTMFGVASEPAIRLEELFDEFVGRYERPTERVRREESDVRREITEHIMRQGLVEKVKFDVSINTPNYNYEFDAAWQNGKTQVLEAISFDLVDPRNIVEKGSQWVGRLFNLTQGGADFAFSAVVAPPAEPTLGRAFDRALTLLRAAPSVRSVVPETEVGRVIQTIRDDTVESQSRAH